MNNIVLVINAGSSSIKFAVFLISEQMTKIYNGILEKVLSSPELSIYDINNNKVLSDRFKLSSYEELTGVFLNKVGEFLAKFKLIAVGHRVVHGGTYYFDPVLINDNVLNDLQKLIPLAPLHQPYNLKLINAIKTVYQDIEQVACFDTGFHAHQDRLVKMFAIPTKLAEEGVIKYGFHGLSYEFISKMLEKNFSEKLANGKILVAHLGNGASICAMKNKKSVASSMGFTALEGLMMGTRCGNIDPGVVLYLLEEKKLSIKEITNLLYKESGLLGVSGISSDVRELEASKDRKAKEAIELFCYRAARELLALSTVLQGIDMIIFTAGIGEHSAFIRSKICEWLSWLGLVIDHKLNNENATIISQQKSKVTVAVIPTNEELMIANHTIDLIKK